MPSSFDLPAISWLLRACTFACGLLACSGEVATPGRAPPAPVAAPHVEPLALAGRYSCAIRRTDVVCWGSHPRAVAARPSPVAYPELRGAVELAAGDSILCGRFARGTVRCSRRHFVADEPPSPIPIEDVPGIVDARAIAAGAEHACALHADGNVSCWGQNGMGQLGDLALQDRAAPTRVTGVGRATAIAAAGWTTCALVVGRPVCWGLSVASGDASAPAVVPSVTDRVSISIGLRHGCGLDRSGQAQCWGANPPETLRPPSPAASFAEVRAGEDFTCGRERNGNVRCWPIPRSTFAWPRPTTSAARIALGAHHGCAIGRNEEIACWGDNEHGRVLGSRPEDRPPDRVVPLDDATDLSAGDRGYCALRRDGHVACWERSSRSTPVNLPSIEHATSVALGSQHGCALVAGGDLWCWGTNEQGQLGIPGVERAADPRRVAGVAGARRVCASAEHTCVVDSSARVRCVGAVGEGGPAYRGEDRWVTRRWHSLAGVERAAEVACGPRLDCARTEDGRVLCWGEDLQAFRAFQDRQSEASLPQGPPIARRFADGAERVWVGVAHACLRRSDRSLQCFGYGDRGQLGTLLTLSHDPVTFPGAETAEDVFLGESTCLRRAGHDIECAELARRRVSPTRRESYVRFVAQPGSADVVAQTGECTLLRDGHVVCSVQNEAGGTPEVFSVARPVPLP